MNKGREKVNGRQNIMNEGKISVNGGGNTVVGW